MANSKSWLRFGIGNLLLIVALAAMGLGWWRDHRRLNSQVELLQLRVEALSPRGGGGGFFGHMSEATVHVRRFESVGELIDVVEAASDGEDYLESDLAASIFQSEHLVAAIPGLIELLKREDPIVRRHVTEILGRVNQPPELVLSALIERLDDHDVVVQRRAVEGLGRLRTKSALPALRRKMLDDDCEVAAFIATVIALDRDTDVGLRLIELTRNKHRANRWLAVSELPNFVDAATAKKVLVEAFAATDRSDKEVRQTIAESINRLVMPDEK